MARKRRKLSAYDYVGQTMAEEEKPMPYGTFGRNAMMAGPRPLPPERQYKVSVIYGGANVSTYHRTIKATDPALAAQKYASGDPQDSAGAKVCQSVEDAILCVMPDEGEPYSVYLFKPSLPRQINVTAVTSEHLRVPTS